MTISKHGRRPPEKKGHGFELRHEGHPKGADYEIYLDERRPELGPCHLWKWNMMGNGQTARPVASIEGKNEYLTRYLFRDQLTPDKPYVLHLCLNPEYRCINLDHVRAGTQQENMLDRRRDGRIGWTINKLRNKPKLVYRIKMWLVSGKYSQAQIAKKVGVTAQAISAIARNITYKYIPWPQCKYPRPVNQE